METGRARQRQMTSQAQYENGFKDKGLINPDEFLIAATVCVSEHDYNSPYVRAFVFQKGNDFESVKKALATIKGAIPVRRIVVELTTEEFLGLFKRFHVMLTWHGLQLEKRDYSAS